MKEYTVKVLYDNGIEESYRTGEVNEEEIDKVANIVITAFRQGVNGNLQITNEDGLSININLSKVSKVEFLNKK